MGEDFTLGTGEGFVGVDLWASEWGRLLQRIGRPPWPRGWFAVAVVLRLWEGRLCETMRDRCGSVVHRGRGRSVSALRVGSYHGRKGWRRVVFKLHRLFSNFTVTGSSVREPCGSVERFSRFTLRLGIFCLRLSCRNLNLLPIEVS